MGIINKEIIDFCQKAANEIETERKIKKLLRQRENKEIKRLAALGLPKDVAYAMVKAGVIK